eukprot:IDg3296t1
MVRCMAVIGDEVFGTCSNGGEVIIWSVTTGEILNRVHIASTSATAIEKLDDSRFVVGSASGELFIYWHEASSNLQEIHRITEVHERMISDISVHSDIMVSVSEDHSAVMRNTNTYNISPSGAISTL